LAVAPPPDPAGERTALPSRLAGFKGHTSKGRKAGRTGGKGKGRGRREGRGLLLR